MNFIYELMILYSFIVCTIYLNRTISDKRKKLKSVEPGENVSK